MLKLHQQFFRTSLIFIIFAFILAIVYSYNFVKSSKIDATISNLKSALDVASLDKNIDKSYLDKLSDITGARVTYINKDGKVIYDTKYSKDKMDNLSKKEEIIKVKKDGFGVTLRYSKRFKKELIYVAKLIDNSFIRLSMPLNSVNSAVYQVVLKIAIFLILFLLVLLYFSNRLNLKIAKDSQEIDSSLDAMLKKDFSIDLIGVSCCREFARIAKKIEKVAKRLKKREKQKSRYTRRLKEITKRQGDIISAISHEFKNPVAAIVGYAQTLKDTPNLNENLKEKFLEKIESNATKISNMIDTLALSIKLENDSIAVKEEEFNLLDVINEAKEILVQKYKNRDIEINCKNICIRADRNMFENLFINLIENALKYSQDKVVIRCNNKKVEIIDYGIGIEEKDIKKIKEKFYRANGISWNNSIGVGLYIVDYILKLHNLELNIKSTKKETNFSFDIDGIVCDN